MISIIIPTFNEEKLLPHLLKSIKEQYFEDVEIIVADGESTDGTKTVAQKFGAKVTKGGKSPASGRNNGAKIAKGKWLLFLDADVILPANFLKKALKEAEERNLDIASCEVEALGGKKIDKFSHELVNIYMRATQRFFPHAPGFCIMTKKEIHQKIGGFNEELKLAEDHDYVTKANKIGKFRLLKTVRIPVSVRRLDRDGRLNIFLKYLAVELHLLFLGPVKSNVFKYKFGHPEKKA